MMPELDGPRFGPAAGGAPRQLVVICHGVGADGHMLIGLATPWSEALPHAAFVAPTAPTLYDQDPLGQGRQWFSLADRTPSVMEAGARRAAAILTPFVDAECARLGLPPEACALAGFSQGAMLVLFAGLRRKAAPKAILAYSGALLGPESLAAELANRPPVLIVHGDVDDVIPVARSHEAEQVLRDARVPVESHYFPGLGHSIDEAGIGLGAQALRRAFGKETD